MTRDSQSSRKRSKWYQHYTVQLVLSNFWHCNMMLSSPKVSGHIHIYCWADVHHKQWIAHTWYRYHLPPFTGPKVKKPWQSAHILGRTLVFTFWNMCCQQRYGATPLVLHPDFSAKHSTFWMWTWMRLFILYMQLPKSFLQKEPKLTPVVTHNTLVLSYNYHIPREEYLQESCFIQHLQQQLVVSTFY